MRSFRIAFHRQLMGFMCDFVFKDRFGRFLSCGRKLRKDGADCRQCRIFRLFHIKGLSVHPIALTALVTDAGLNQLASTSSSASFYIVGSSFPRRSARRRIPSHARLLKKHFAGASGCKIDDKVDAISSLGHAPVFRSLNAPCDGVMISHDLSGVEPFSLRRLRN